MSKFVSKWLIDPSVSFVSASESHTGESKPTSVSSVSAHVMRDEIENGSRFARTTAQGISFLDSLSLDNGKTDQSSAYAQSEHTDKTDRSSEAEASLSNISSEGTDKADKTEAAKKLLITLRITNIRTRLDGDLVRCEAPKGCNIPAGLAEQIRTLKSALLELLREEQAEIDWRAESGLLLELPTVRPVGACAFCGAAMPSGQTGRCVLCCLAAAAVLEQHGPIGSATYPEAPAVVVDYRQTGTLRDMSGEGEAA